MMIRLKDMKNFKIGQSAIASKNPVYPKISLIVIQTKGKKYLFTLKTSIMDPPT